MNLYLNLSSKNGNVTPAKFLSVVKTLCLKGVFTMGCVFASRAFTNRDFLNKALIKAVLSTVFLSSVAFSGGGYSSAASANTALSGSNPSYSQSSTQNVSATFGDSTKSLGPSLASQAKMPVKKDTAENLYSIVKSELYEDGRWQRRIYTSIRINDLTAARDYGRISIRFNHYYSDLELEFANTLNKNGKKESLSSDALQRRVTGGGQDFYSDSSELVFSMPDIAPGSILEFQYIKTSKERPFPELFFESGAPFWPQQTVGQDGWRADFVHNYTHTVVVPNSVELHQKTFSGHPKPKRKKLDAQRVQYSWSMNNVKGLTSEGYMPNMRDVMPMVHLSTLKDWAAVDAWSWEKIQDKLTPTEAVKRIIHELALPLNATNQEKVHAVYEYLQGNVRYVFAHLGRGGYTPHAPDEVINNSYGDCKDQAVLTVALLRALGVDAYPALVETPRAGDSDTELVGLIFDHMIVYIAPNQGVDIQWLDTTADRSLFPGTSSFLTGQNAFVVNGSGGRLMRFPKQQESIGLVEITGFKNKKGQQVAQVRVLPQGYFEQNIRSWWKHTKDQENALMQYLKALYNNTSNAQVTGEVLFAEDLFHPVEITAQYVFESEEQEVYGASVHQLFRLFSDPTDLPLPDTRQFGFYNPYPFKLHLRGIFKGSTDTIPAVIQTTDGIASPYFDLTYEGHTSSVLAGAESKNSSNHDVAQYTLNIQFNRKALDLSLAEYAKYFKDVGRLEQSGTWLVNMLPSAEEASKTDVANVQKSKGEDSVEYYIALAQRYIDSGEFNKALKPAQQAVDASEASGEAWYILGTAQGLNTLIDEAEVSFKKAEELGFYPQ